MDRPKQFAHHRFVGDKRYFLVYDIDELDDSHQARIDELMDSQAYLCFGPDTLPEARNRGYRLFQG